MDQDNSADADKIDDIADQLDDVQATVDELGIDTEGVPEHGALRRLKNAVERARDAADELEEGEGQARDDSES